MAATQRPITQDLNIPASVQRFTARRAHAHTIEVARRAP